MSNIEEHVIFSSAEVCYQNTDNDAADARIRSRRIQSQRTAGLELNAPVDPDETIG